jgi:hypothetical protein
MLHNVCCETFVFSYIHARRHHVTQSITSYSKLHVVAHERGAEDSQMGRDMRFANSIMHPRVRQVVLKGPSVGIVPVLVRDHVSLVLVSQLQLWHLH